VNAWDDLSDRARELMTEYDELTIAEMLATAEAASEKVTAGTPLVCSDERHAAKVADLEAELAQLRAHILDIDAHATPYGDLPDEPGYAGTYLLTAGALHRAIGKVGHTSPSCTAEAELAALQAGCPDPIECNHEAMVGQLAEDVRYLLGYTGPRHAHLQAGIWDDTGLPCAHCARLEEARQRLAALNGADIVPGGDVDAEPSP